jgi:predicted ATP-grasp superfamily ATP-dependent carboligase
MARVGQDGVTPRIASVKGVVVDVGWVNGLAAIRSLGRAGIPVFAVDYRSSPLGFHSRYAQPVTVPDPLVDEPAFVDAVARIGGPAVVFPTHDPPLNAIARHADRLDGFLFPFPSWERLEAIQDKRHQLETAREAGVDIPETLYPSTAAEAAGLPPPVLVKPQHPDGFKRRFGKQAFRCETTAELERAFADAEPFGPMVQELVPGGDDELYSFGSYLRADGEPLGLFCGRKLKQVPPVVGTCRVGEAVWVQDVVDAGLRLLNALGFHGISQVEFKRDPRDGRFKLMEVNPRLWQWHGLAAACGVDLPLIAYRDLTGERVESASMNGARRTWSISLMPGERPDFPRPPYVDAVFARDDLKPGLVHAARVARGVFR